MMLGVLGCLTAPASASATPVTTGPLLVDFFFDLADDGVVEPGRELDGLTGAPSDMLIAGIPIRLGEHDGTADDGWRTIAGARGQYTVPLSNILTTVSTVRVAQTDFVGEAAGKVVASAATDLRFASDGWTLALRPGLDVARWETYVQQRDSSLEGRVSKSLGGGLSLASTARYRWRDSTVDQSQAETAFGRVGLVCRLPEQVRVEVAYVTRQEVAAESTRGAGPSAAVTLPLVENIDLSANYDLTQTVRYDTADAQQNDQAWDRHHLGLGMTWDAGDDASAVKLSAAYRYEHGGAAADQRDEANHAGTVGFALDF